MLEKKSFLLNFIPSIHCEAQVEKVLFPAASADLTAFDSVPPSSNNLAVLTGEKLHIFGMSSDTTKENSGAPVRITGAGGNGYTVKTSRHTLLRSLTTKDLPDGLVNLVWFGNFLIGSVDYPAPAVVSFKVSLSD